MNASSDAKDLLVLIDRSLAWSPGTLELIPVEHREVDVKKDFELQAYCPADSVTLVTVADAR